MDLLTGITDSSLLGFGNPAPVGTEGQASNPVTVPGEDRLDTEPLARRHVQQMVRELGLEPEVSDRRGRHLIIWHH